jgi:hypothetical protein
VTIDAIYHLDGGSCIAFSHEWLGIGAATLHAIQPEQTELQREIAMVNSFSLQHDHEFLCEELELIAKYVIENVRGK